MALKYCSTETKDQKKCIKGEITSCFSIEYSFRFMPHPPLPLNLLFFQPLRPLGGLQLMNAGPSPRSISSGGYLTSPLEAVDAGGEIFGADREGSCFPWKPCQYLGVGWGKGSQVGEKWTSGFGLPGRESLYCKHILRKLIWNPIMSMVSVAFGESQRVLDNFEEHKSVRENWTW